MTISETLPPLPAPDYCCADSFAEVLTYTRDLVLSIQAEAYAAGRASIAMGEGEPVGYIEHSVGGSIEHGVTKAAWQLPMGIKFTLYTAQPAPAAPAVPTIDLDLLARERIKKAASASNWIPPQYFRNDWVADVCEFLKECIAPAQPMTLGQLRDVCKRAAADAKAKPGLSEMDTLLENVARYTEQFHKIGITAQAGEVK